MLHTTYRNISKPLHINFTALPYHNEPHPVTLMKTNFILIKNEYQASYIKIILKSFLWYVNLHNLRCLTTYTLYLNLHSLFQVYLLNIFPCKNRLPITSHRKINSMEHLNWINCPYPRPLLHFHFLNLVKFTFLVFTCYTVCTDTLQSRTHFPHSVARALLGNSATIKSDN